MERLHFSRWFALVLGLSLALYAPQSGAAERRLLTFPDADYAGSDYRTVKDTTLDACQATCLADTQCKAFTFNSNANWCFLKNGVGALSPAKGAIAGRVVAGVSSPAAPAIDLSFLPDSLAQEAVRYKAKLPKPNIDSVTQALAVAHAAQNAGDPRAAAAALRDGLARDPKNAGVWTFLANMLLATKPANYTQRYQLPEFATAAALNALTLPAPSQIQLDSLGALAQALQRRKLWRPALQTLKASLALREVPETRVAYDKLRATRGFRMLDYSVDADAAAPRLCIQFSEKFKNNGAGIEDFIVLNGARPPAVTVEAQQICIDGLKHGQRYQVTVRSGLPSDVGETIEEPIELTTYVRDRSPTVRFTGNNYVLPRVGAKGIPVVTINTDLVKITISRIGDRGLAAARRDNNFLANLTGYQAENIAEQSGIEVWKGEMPVSPKLNSEVVTAFPVDEVLKSPEPGIYVMIARIRNSETRDWDTQATQWFVVSDLGLAALNGRDGVHVFVRSLASAEPVAGAKLRLIAVNNEILGTGQTDARGYVRFAAGLARGTGGMAPAMVTAQMGDDFALLEVDKPGFDLTDRGVDGRAPPGPVDIYAFTERGVYRPGATVRLVALARDAQVNAATTPLTFIVRRPDGVEYTRQTSRGDGLGGHNFDITLNTSVMTGTWRVATYTDPKQAPLAQTKFLVEDFVPERIDFKLATQATEISARTPASISLAGRYLYGAPASGLRLEGEVIVRPARKAPRGFAGYNFGIADEEVPAVRGPLANLAPTAADGSATLTAALPPLPDTTRLLEAEFIVRMRESGGRAVERTLVLPVASGAPAIGIKPLFGEDGPGEGQEAGFTVRVMGADGKDASLAGATWSLMKIERRYQWYRLDGRWNYEPTSRTSRVANGTTDIIAGTPASISAPVKWGRYRIEIAGAGPDAPVSAYEFSAGWYGADATSQTPDVLTVALDQPAYRAGDTARLRLSPRYAGKALVTVMADRLLAMKLVDVPASGTDVAIQVSDDWGAGAYVSATLYRPMDTTAGRNPTRAMGLQWLTVSHEKRRLTVAIDTPATITPRTTLEVPVTLTGLAAGQEARLTLAAVDVGILNLTGYKAPAPEGWYFGQRRLGVEIRDLYGKLIDGMQGVRGQARSGAGETGLTTNGAPRTEKAVALFSGIVRVGADGKARVTLDIPQFNGTLKLMAVAWSATGLGQASTEMIVRDPVVLTASLPRFLAPGDTSRLRLDIANVEGPAGDWDLNVVGDGPVQIGDDKTGTISLESGQSRIVDLALSAGAVGTSRITVSLSHPDGTQVTRELAFNVRAPQPPITHRSVQTLAAAGGSMTLSDDLFANIVPGTGSVTLTVSNGLLIDTPGLLSALDRYPYGCSEQITSRALPLLYLNQVASNAGIGADREIRARVEEAITKVLQRQGANGSIGLWSPGGEDLWLDAYVADFLTRAKETGYKVPGGAFTQLLDRLENSLAFAGEVPDAGREIAYALYVLARNSRASIGDLRYFVDTKLDEFSSPLAKAQLGGALVIYGDAVRAQTAFSAAFADAKAQLASTSGRYDFGSRLRDGAAVLTLATEGQNGTRPRADIIKLVEEHRARTRATSTQENAWLLLAVNAANRSDDQLSLSFNGAEQRGKFARRFSRQGLASVPATIVNRSQASTRAVVTVRGVPTDPQPAMANGFSISRDYFTLDGTPVNPAQVGQNERLVVVLSAVVQDARATNPIIADLLPAGFEIDNPRLVRGGETGEIAWLGEMRDPVYTAFRDDRFIAAFKNPRVGDALKAAYVVRAVSPGRFVHPPAVVEDMYVTDLRARTGLGQVTVVGPVAR